MAIKSSLLPDNILRRMDKADRAPMGKAGVTQAEANSKADTRREKELQREMENLLRQRNLWFVRSRMDKKHTLAKGTPDFIVVLRGGHTLLIEAKVHGGRFSPAQISQFDDFVYKTGTHVHVITNLQQFRDLLDQH